MKTQVRFWLLAPMLQLGCSTTTTPVTIELPQSISFASVTVAGQPDTWTPDHPVALPLPCNPRAPLLVGISPEPQLDSSTNTATIDNFTLTVPGDCGSSLSCGWLVVRAIAADGSTKSVPGATSPITVNGINALGVVTFQLELHDAYDVALKGTDGNPLGDEITVEFTDPLGCLPSDTTDAGL